MSATALDRGEGGVTTAQVEGLVEQCNGLQSAINRARAFRRLLLLGLLAFFVAFGWLYWQLIERVRSEDYRLKLADEARARLEERQDEYMREVNTLVEKSTPVVAESFSKQIQQDIPVYLKAAEKEANQFAEEIKSKAETRYRNQIEAMLKKHEEILIEEIPSLKDIELRERMINNMRKALESLAQKYAIDPIGTEIAALYEKWDRFPAVPPPEAGDPPLEERLVGEGWELLLDKLVEHRSRNRGE